MGRKVVKMKCQKISEQFDEIKSVLELKGCPTSLALSFIKNNLSYLKEADITNKIYIIYNHNEIYAILIIDKNNYYWSVCQDNILYPLEKKTKENKDYIIEMMLNFANEEKIKKIVPNISEMNTETKVKVLRSFHFNSTGYHFK